MARPASMVPVSKATYSLPTSQVEFIEERAKAQTKTLKQRKARHPVVFPSHLVSLAISFYQRWPDIVENALDWKGKVPIIWPRQADRADAACLSESEARSAPSTDVADSHRPSDEPAGQPSSEAGE